MQKVSKTSLKCSFHWGKADVFICRKPNGVPAQGQTYAPVRREVARGSLHWQACFTLCNLLLQKVNPCHVSRRQTRTCCTCGCIQWKDLYSRGRQGQEHSSSSHFSRKAMLNSKFLCMSHCSQTNMKLRNINLQVREKGQESTMCRCYKGLRLSQAFCMFPDCAIKLSQKWAINISKPLMNRFGGRVVYIIPRLERPDK